MKNQLNQSLISAWIDKPNHNNVIVVKTEKGIKEFDIPKDKEEIEKLYYSLQNLLNDPNHKQIRIPLRDSYNKTIQYSILDAIKISRILLLHSGE